MPVRQRAQGEALPCRLNRCARHCDIRRGLPTVLLTELEVVEKALDDPACSSCNPLVLSPELRRGRAKTPREVKQLVGAPWQ
jgi:hypothetical protein